MVPIVLTGIVGAVVVLAVGTRLAVAPVRPIPRYTTVGSRLRTARDQLTGSLTPVGAYATLVAAGSAVVVAAFWTFGRVVRHLQPADWAAFHWFSSHQPPGWTAAMRLLTQMANKQETWVVSAVAIVALGILAWRRDRRWWLPLLTIATMVLLQHYENILLGLAVHRGHPPTTHGTYPSGGASRAVSIYGFIACLGLRYAQPRSRPVVAAVGTFVGLVCWFEGYARLYNSQHWMTDVIGGWLSGAGLLLVMTFAASALLVRPDTGRHATAPRLATTSS